MEILKDLPRRTASGKAFFDETFDSAKNPKYDGYEVLLQRFINFLVKNLLLRVQIKRELIVI